MGPYDETYPWNPNIIKTINKLIKNIISLQEKVCDKPSDEETLKLYYSMLKNVTNMIENLKMNTCVSEIMIFIKKIQNNNYIGKDVWLGFLKVLSVFAPFISEDLWQEINNYSEWKKKNSIHLQPWPLVEEKYLEIDTVVIPVQINGKVRTEILISKSDTEDIVKEKALSDEKILVLLRDKNIQKFVYIKDRIANIVLKP